MLKIWYEGGKNDGFLEIMSIVHKPPSLLLLMVVQTWMIFSWYFTQYNIGLYCDICIVHVCCKSFGGDISTCTFFMAILNYTIMEHRIPYEPDWNGEAMRQKGV